MKISIKQLLITITLLLLTSRLYSQVGINTSKPDPSSVLELSSSNKGFLMTRLTTAKRDSISNPAPGLMFYNTTLGDVQINNGTISAPIWVGIKKPVIPSVTSSGLASTTSLTDVVVPGMSVTSPASGNYLVMFNCQSGITQTFRSAQGVLDVNSVFDKIKGTTATGTHALVFGNGETLVPGVYDVAGAMSILGTLTLDGNNNANSVFIMRAPGAFTTGATTTNVQLINNASAANVFWLSDAAMSTGAGTIIKGTLYSGAGAIALGANTNLEGRMLTESGALTMGATSTLAIPSGTSNIDLKSLSTFAMFSANGAVSDCTDCTVTGDVGNGGGGPLTITGTHTGKTYPANTIGSQGVMSYSIYKNGVQVPNSTRTTGFVSNVIFIQSIVTVNAGDVIDIRWNIGEGTAQTGNRTLSMIQSGN